MPEYIPPSHGQPPCYQSGSCAKPGTEAVDCPRATRGDNSSSGHSLGMLEVHLPV